jgi:putative transposase
MTKQKSSSSLTNPDSGRYAELAAALIATPQMQQALRSATSYDDLVGGDGLIAGMLRPLLQEMINAEMTEHLGYPKHHAEGNLSGNSRNGSYERNLRGSDGNLALDMPRDRNGVFNSTVVRPYKQVSSELEQKITSLYAFGTSTADIVGFLQETYGVAVSTGFISQVTEKVLELAREWQSRPLQTIYTIAYLDAIHIKCREQNKVVNKAVHIVMA